MSIGQVNEAELEQRLGLVEMARSWSPRVIAKLENVIRSYQDDDLYRFNPVRYAIQTGMAESEAIALFLHATRSGLFIMEWHLVCEACGHLVESLRSMGNLHSHYKCDLCFAENEATLDDFIHVTFTVSPEIRRLVFHEPDTLPIADFYFKYRMAKGIRPLPQPGEPTFVDVILSLTKMLTYLEPGERQAIELDAPVGSFFRISDLLNNTVCAVILGPALSEQKQHVQVALIDHKLRVVDKDVLPATLETPTFDYNIEQVCTLPGGKIVFELENRTSKRSSVWIMLAPQDLHPPRLEFEAFLSGKRLLTDPTFRELFGDEALDESQNIGIKNITFLFSDLKGSTALYHAVGDVQGYHLVRRHFAALTRAVTGHSGAIVKTIGDEVMATFADPVDAEVSKLQGVDAVKFSLRMLMAQTESILKSLPAMVKANRIDALILDTVQFYAELGPIQLGMPYIQVAAALHFDFSGYTPLCLYGWPHQTTPAALARNREGVVNLVRLLESVNQGVKAHTESAGLKIDWEDPGSTVSPLALITQVPRAFDFESSHWPSQFHHTGAFHDGKGREKVDFPWERITGEPLIYASMGTILNGRVDVFRTIVAALAKHKDLQLVLSVGNQVDPKKIGPVPNNAIIVKQAPQLELLKQASVCITHAGLNTVLESLAQGVPQVAIPVTYDQPGVAARIADKQTGVVTLLDKLTADHLSALLNEVLSNSTYRENARSLQNAIAEANGLSVAADLVEQSLGVGTPLKTPAATADSSVPGTQISFDARDSV